MAAGLWLYGTENIGGPASFIFVIPARFPPRRCRRRGAHVGVQSDRLLIQTNHWFLLVVGAFVHFQDVFHLGDVVFIEVGYVPLAEMGAEFLFQVIAERAERAAVLLTTNLPFSEWTQVIPNARLCKAVLDRITDRAHIIETGTDSFRFKRTLAQRQRNGGGNAEHSVA